jgi:transposase
MIVVTGVSIAALLRQFIVSAYPSQTHEMLFDAHHHAFPVLGSVPRHGIDDNVGRRRLIARGRRIERDDCRANAAGIGEGAKQPEIGNRSHDA